MPRRTTRRTPNKNTSSTTPTRHYSHTSNTPKANHHTSTNVPQNSMIGNIAQGMTLGAGAAIGSSMVHGTLGSMSTQADSNKEVVNTKTHENEVKCGYLMRQFSDCCTIYDDLNNCKPLLDYYKTCMSNNNL